MMKLDIQLFANGSNTLIGTLNGAGGAYGQFYAIRNYTQDEENATTKETIKLYLKRVSSYVSSYNSSAPYTISETIVEDGVEKTNSLKKGNCSFDFRNTSVGNSVLLATYERTLKHEEDGTYADYTLNATITTGTGLGNGSISKVISTPTISTSYPVSISDLNISLNNVLSIVVGTRESTNYVYDLTYRIGKEEDETPFVGEIGINLTENNKLWELNSSLITSIKEKMSDTSTLPITIYCATKKYIEESYVQIGTIKQSTAHLVITEKPQIVYPTIEEMIENIKVLTNSESVVKELSKMKFTFSIEPPYGTTIKQYYAIIGERRLSSLTNELIIENITENSNGIVPISIYVVDARGIESVAMSIENPSLNFINYIKSEYINTECVVKRNESDIDKVSVNLKANFFEGQIGTTDNEITLGYKYKEKGATNYTVGTSSLKLNTDIVLAETFDHTKNYEIVFTINDLICTGSKMTKQVAKSQYIMLEHENGVDFLNATILGKQIATTDELPKSNIVFETLLTEATNEVIIDDLNIVNDGSQYEIIIYGASTVNTDLSVQINDLAGTNYHQQGVYWQGILSANGNLTAYSGYRPNMNRFYYGLSMRSSRGRVKMEFSLFEYNEVDQLVMDWESSCACYQAQNLTKGNGFMTDISTLNKISIKTANGNFMAGTRVILRKK